LIAKNQVSQSCLVDRVENELWITNVFISTACEASVHIKVDVRSFKIKYAWWYVYRTPDCVLVRSGEIPVLIETDVQEYSTNVVLQDLDPDLREILVELISESIRCTRQSEVFISKERGYESYKEFKEYRNKILLDSCVCFSNLNHAGMLCTNHMGEQNATRIKDLFQRHKNYHIFANTDGKLFSTACFADTFHEIHLAVSFSQCGQIENISGTFLRSPSKMCCGSEKILNNLVGKNLSKMTKKEIAEFVGGSSGCTHILEMCYDLGLSLKEIELTSELNELSIAL